MERLNHLLINLKPTILILTEHGLSTENLLLTKVQGYNLMADFSREQHKLGGVAIYAIEMSDIIVEKLDIKHHCIELLCEAAMIKMVTKQCSFYLLGLYRPPGGNTKHALETISEILSTTKADAKQTIIMGDVNFNRLTANHDNILFEEELTTFGIKRLPLPATRIASTSITSIDCICTNLPEDTVNFAIIQDGISDHTGQLCKVQYKDNNGRVYERTLKRNFCKRNLDYLQRELDTEDWDNVHNAINAEESYNSFQAIVRRALDITCPLSKSKPKSKPKLKFKYNPVVNTLKDEFLNSLRKYELTGNELDKDTMKRKKKSYDLKLRELRQAAANDHITNSDNKSKALWNIINSVTKQTKPNDLITQLEIQGKIEESPVVIAEHFNKYFCQVADITLKKNRNTLQINTVLQQPETSTRHSPQLTLAPTTLDEVLSIIQSLKPKLSFGIDEVPSKAVKHCAHQLAAPLVSVINKSFNLGQFPSKLKLSKIYPKYKKGSKTNLENYRPISLISPFSKIIEKIALKRMVQHMQDQELLSKSQHGFLKGRSTITAITNLVEFITDQLEDNKFVSAILLDYSKAFDCLGHDLILNKLSLLGFQGKAKDWVASYLEGRSQIVEIHRTINKTACTFRSHPQPVTRGVPQGSVLGPFLFVLFTNDFNDYINHSNILPIMYADDTTLLLQHDTAQGLYSAIINSTEKALHYCLQNDLAINPSKTTQLNFSRRHEQIPGAPDILVVNHSKLLGMTVDTNLSWTEHVASLSKKLGSGIFVVRRIRWIAGREAARTAYHALVESHIRYGLAIWGGTSQQNLERILTLQKKAIRALANLSPRESCRDAFKSLRIMTVIALYIHSIVVYTNQTELTRGENIHSYSTRRAADYVLPIHHTTQYSRKPSYIGRKICNSLPQNLKTLKGQQLKRQLQDWLMERPFYSMKEYFDAS